MTIASIECLPDEIFVEIFRYLDGYDILQSFLNLNHRFRQLLTSSSLKMRVKLCEEILLPQKYQIYSLHLSYDLHMDQFLTSCPIDSSFNHLESLNIQFIRTDQVLRLLQNLLYCPRLHQLTIRLVDNQIDLYTIYSSIFRLRVLNYLKISSLGNGLSFFWPYQSLKSANLIKYLIIDHPCTVNDIMTILSFTPNLCHLTCKKSLTCLFTSFPLIATDKLIFLSLKDCQMDFDTFEIFLRRISSNLQIMKVVTFNDSSYLDANRWQQLISTNMLQLQKFYFEYHEYFDDDYKVTPVHQSANQFTNQFLIEKQWKFDISIDNFEIIYSIQPYTNEILDSKLRLRLTKHLTESLNKSLIRKLDPFLTAFKITHLNVDCSNIPILMLTKLIQKLSYLTNLTILCLPSCEAENWLNKKHRIVRLSQKNHSITQVNLHSISDMQQIEFVICLCPFVEYLTMNCTDDIDLTSLVKLIFQTNHKCIEYLKQLCLIVPPVRDELIQNLWRMANSCRCNFAVKYINEIIYFQRNL
ncbi:unnamed protein product [Adineta ricciae]|uniref:F-box domain-containing protein n=1 Tax=Adineta ricciae TaxID=249248 RepID=A0A814WL77_ADIRI|nr:unnamed protein product [Adineta ricciae]CAF1335538.1 unnamed protein product [Adineta ricciae]